jgi:endonuclease/exonuclease/phosphatase family metal-dependent hydrolase
VSFPPLRIVTINTAKCDGDYAARIPWLAEELQRLAPDVVACQECWRAADGSADTAQTLAQALGMALAYAPARRKPRPFAGRPTDGWSGMALLARQPWQWVEQLDLPADPRDGERLCQAGALRWGDRTVVIANTHLTHLADADALREQQLRTLLGWPALAEADALRLVCGDLNTPLNGPLIQNALAGAYGPSLRDLYREGGGVERGTQPGSPRRIDALLAFAAGPTPPARDAAIVLDRPRPGSGVLPSDHFGVAVTLGDAEQLR